MALPTPTNNSFGTMCWSFDRIKTEKKLTLTGMT